MNTVELIKVINNIPVKGEVCAKDLLPEKKPLDVKAYIVNTDISTDPGEHWVAIYFRRDQVIYFDSYGRPPEEQYVLPFIERNSSRWIHNKECLQSPWSKVCGMWCIYIIHQLNKGLALNTAIHQELYGTGDDLYQNDRDMFVCLFCCFTSHVNSYGHCVPVSSLNHTFSWAGLSKRLTSNLCTYFRL